MIHHRRFAALASALLLAGVLSACTPAGSQQGQNDPTSPARQRGAKLAAERCEACHGAAGVPIRPDIPRLGQQWPEYLHKQLAAFASPEDAPNHRKSEIMTPIARALSDRDMSDLALWFSERLRPSAGARNPARVALGRELFMHGSPPDDLPACASCHRPSGGGIQPDFPNLAGQSPDYVEHQLAVWESTRGHRGKLMSLIVPHMRPEQRAPLADYIATLKSTAVDRP